MNCEGKKGEKERKGERRKKKERKREKEGKRREKERRKKLLYFVPGLIEWNKRHQSVVSVCVVSIVSQLKSVSRLKKVDQFIKTVRSRRHFLFIPEFHCSCFFNPGRKKNP